MVRIICNFAKNYPKWFGIRLKSTFLILDSVMNSFGILLLKRWSEENFLKNDIPESLSAWDEIKRNSWWSIAELEHRSIEQNASSVRISLKWPQVTYIKNKMFKARFQNVYSYVKKLKMEIISSSSKFNIVIGTLTQTTCPSIDYRTPADGHRMCWSWREDRKGS